MAEIQGHDPMLIKDLDSNLLATIILGAEIRIAIADINSEIIEEDWIAQGDDWDLNIWYDEEKECHIANLHKVVDRSPQTETWFRLFPAPTS